MQVEINPFVETPQGQVVSVDAKIGFDDNAKFRQQEIFNMEDTTECDPREVEANKYNLNYIGMDGNIGCLGKLKKYIIRFLGCLLLSIWTRSQLMGLDSPWQRWTLSNSMELLLQIFLMSEELFKNSKSFKHSKSSPLVEIV